MYLEKIEIQGFKSFAQKTTLLFNRELTAIVGPNGSGKSNVADAIRWVLGEQSLKLLRGKKSEDVIFAGSGTKGRLGFAKVAIFMNNKDRQAGIDYDQIIIERTLQRSGESEYMINNSKVRLTDIVLLLAKAQVGQKSYSIIGQGTIDNLLSLSAQERRDFFDEATGVRQYQLKKNQALNKLEHTEDNLQQAELVLTELAPRLRALTRQVKRLERKEELEKQLYELQGDYYSYLTTEINKQHQKILAKKQKEDGFYNDLTKEQQTIQHQLDTYEQERGREDDFNTLQTKLRNIQQEYNSLTKKKVVLEGQKDLDLIKQGDADKVILKTRLEDLQMRTNNFQIKIDDLDKQTHKTKSFIDLLKKQATETKKKLHVIEESLSRKTTNVDWDKVEKEAATLHADHDQLIFHFDKIQSSDELPHFKEKLNNFADRLKKFITSIKKKDAADYQTLWGDFNKLKNEQDSLNQQLNEEQLKLELNQQEKNITTTQLNDIAKEVQSVKRELDTEQTGAHDIHHDIKEIEKELKEKDESANQIRKEIDNFNQTEENKKQSLLKLQKKFRTIQYDLTVKNNELTTLKVELAKVETRKEDLETEIAHEAPNVPTSKEVHHLNTDETKEQIASTQKKLNIIGGIDKETIEEYKEVKEKHDFLTQQTTDLRQAQKSLISLIDDLDEQIGKQFNHAFKNINVMFSKYFKKLFNGGHSKLTIQIKKTQTKEEADEVSEDEEAAEETAKEKRKSADSRDYSVEIQASPPGKKLSSINMLSGGEKALTAIALVCAVIANNPPPFVVLDEVDAALDEANSIRFAEIIAELTHKSQFITITHNRATMHQAQILYGVTMGDDGISRLLSVNFDQADKMSA